MISNYTSGTAYAWWLMEHFWKLQAKLITVTGGSAFLAYPKIDTLSDSIVDAPIEVVELTLPWKTLQQKKTAEQFVKKNDIKILYFTDQPFFNIQYGLIRHWGVKKIITHDHIPGDEPPTLGIKGLLKTTRNKLRWLTADYVFCVSELMKHRNTTNGRISASKCIIIQNGVTPLNCDALNRKNTRNNLNIDINDVVIVTSGRAHPYKRFDFIINTAYFILNASPSLKITFLLIGDGPAFHDLQKQINTLGIENRVKLLGYRSDVPELLCAADIAFHAALGEGFSLSIIEYMSAGLPVLVPDIPSVSQAINNNINGYIYPTDNNEQTANIILKLISNPEKRKKMGIQAKNDANSKYSLEKCTRDFISAIDKIHLNLKH